MANTSSYQLFYNEANQLVKKQFDKELIKIASVGLDRSGEPGKEKQVNVTILLHENVERNLKLDQIKSLGKILKDTAGKYGLTVHFENISGSLFQF